LKATLIISVYDNIPFLRAVLDSLQWQTEQQFEIIISEDAEHEEMARFVDSYPFRQPHMHLTQPDLGWRKELALNRAVEAAHTDWLIFIDGDCLLHPHFVEMHLRYAAPDVVLAGKRLRLTKTISEQLLSGEIDVRNMPGIVRRKLWLGGGGLRHIEEGFFLHPDSCLGRLIAGRTNHSLTGCNMSMSHDALRRINGFDEDYTRPAVGEDADLVWRLDGVGVKKRSLRNLAVQYHLWHPASWTDQTENLALMHERQSACQYVCNNGIQKH